MEQFLVTWVGAKNTPKAGHIGVSAIDPSTTFWNEAIEASSHAEPATAERNRTKGLSPRSKTVAQAAH
jgi:hypothetical protein